MDTMTCVNGDQGFATQWQQAHNQQAADQHVWVRALRARGFKAAHPNDGWVNRNDKEVHFMYPQFNDEAGTGDLVMLGWHYDSSSWRPVRLVEKRVATIGELVWWMFEDARDTQVDAQD